MFATSLRLCAVLALLSFVRGQTITAQLAEGDFATNENDLSFDSVAVSVTGNQVGDVTFRITMYTVDQFNNLQSTQPEGMDVCNIELSLPDIDQGELEDLAMTSVTCTRPGPTSLSSDVSCPIALAEDTILEGNEFLIAVLTAEPSANTVNFDRNCAILRILAGTFDSTAFSLEVVEQDLVAVEGPTETMKFINIRKKFDTDLPIELSFRSSSVVPAGADSPFAPVEGVDYSFNNGVETGIIFPANETLLQLPLTILSDRAIERTEYLTLTFSARINVPDTLVTDIAVLPDFVNIAIMDDDVLVFGFVDDTPRVVAEGESLPPLCVELKNDSATSPLERGVQPFFRIEGEPTSDYQVNDIFPFELDLELSAPAPDTPICIINFTALENVEVEGNRTYRVVLFDLALESITDPAERARHESLNMVRPNEITITITDNDGSPNQPSIDTLGAQDGDLVFTWTRPDEENGLRNVRCYNGTIIRREVIQVSETDRRKRQDDDSMEDSEDTVFTFKFCNPSELRHLLENYDPEYSYEVVVCATNDFGVNCSEPRVLFPPPAPPPPVPGLSQGAIAGIVVGILLLVLCCCLILLLLFCLLWFCVWDRERRYFPAKREKQFAQFRHSAHVEVDNDEFDIVKVPLE